MRIIVGIPARMGSSRFPGKPLAKICGMPMIEHVYKRCRFANNIDEIFVATCDNEIKDVVEGFGGIAIMTPKTIERPGLRVAEACKIKNYDDNDIVVVVQGDEPLVHPGMINVAVEPMLKEKDLQIGTLVAPANETEWMDTNEVKVITDMNDNILYMTRSPVPSNTRNRIGTRLKQVAIMPFRKKFLLDFQNMPMTPHEIAESVELLRAVESGIRTKAIRSPYNSISVDTENDRKEAELLMSNDEFYLKYK